LLLRCICIAVTIQNPVGNIIWFGRLLSLIELTCTISQGNRMTFLEKMSIKKRRQALFFDQPFS